MPVDKAESQPSETPPPGGHQSIWRLVGRLLGRCVTIAKVALTVAVIGLVIWAVVDATTGGRSRIDIQLLTVPNSLTEAGFSSQAVTERLRDEIRDIHRRALADRAAISKQIKRYELPLDVADITVPGTGVSLKLVTGAIRQVLPLPEQQQISGGFTTSGTALRLRLSWNDVIFDEAAESPDGVAELLKQAALRIVETTEPIVYVSFRIKDPSEPIRSLFDKETLPILISRMLESSKPGDDNFCMALYLNGVNDAPRKDRSAVEAMLRTLVGRCPRFGFGHVELGAVLRDSGRIEEGLDEWRTAIRTDKGSAAAVYYYLGTAALDSHNYMEAIANLRLASQSDPLDPAPHAKAGEALAALGERDEAVSEYYQALRLRPEDQFQRWSLARALAQFGYIDEAEIEYRRLVREKGDFLHFALARLIFENKGRLGSGQWNELCEELNLSTFTQESCKPHDGPESTDCKTYREISQVCPRAPGG